MLGLAQLDLQSRCIVWANSAFASILGYTPSEIAGMSVLDLTHPEERPLTQARLTEVRQGQMTTASVERRYRRKDGTYVWVNLTATIVRDNEGAPAHLLGVMQDISERKRQELEVRQSESRLHTILDTVQDVVWSFSATEYRLIYMNSSATERLYHRSAQEFLTNPDLWMEVVHPDDRDIVARIWERLALFGTTEDNYRILRPHGEVRWVHARAWMTKGPDGNPIRFEGVVRDVHENKAAEIALRESETKLRLAMEAGKVGMWELNLATNEGIWSKVLKDILGLPENFPPAPGEFLKMIHPDDLQKVSIDSQKIRDGEQIGQTSFRIVRPDGAIRWLQHIGKVVRVGDNESGNLIGAMVDITEAKAIQQTIEAQKAKMIAASKMSALGEMAGGLAHEINNPIAIIHGNAAMLKNLASQRKVAFDEISKTAEIIETTAERISKITRSLRSFAREADRDPFEEIFMKSVVDETAEFCRERFRGHGIEFLIGEIDPDLKIECRPVQLSQVLLNLLNNAHDAVEKLKDRWIRISIADLGERLEISVEDSGSGISGDLGDRIFQPFFTTKEVGKGTGLGLSVAKGIVESHRGQLSIDSSKGHTRFVVNVPKRQPKK